MRRRKIHYIPGLISLLALPVVLLFMKPEPVKYQTTLRLALCSDEKPPGGMHTYSRYMVYENIKKKKIIQVDLWESQPTHYLEIKQEKKRFINSEIQRLQFTHDTNTVLKVTLDSTNTYGDFVWLVNQAQVYRFKRYAFVDDAFFYIPDPRPVYLPPQEPGIKTLDL